MTNSNMPQKKAFKFPLQLFLKYKCSDDRNIEVRLEKKEDLMHKFVMPNLHVEEWVKNKYFMETQFQPNMSLKDFIAVITGQHVVNPTKYFKLLTDEKQWVLLSDVRNEVLDYKDNELREVDKKNFRDYLPTLVKEKSKKPEKSKKRKKPLSKVDDDKISSADEDDDEQVGNNEQVDKDGYLYEKKSDLLYMYLPPAERLVQIQHQHQQQKQQQPTVSAAVLKLQKQREQLKPILPMPPPHEWSFVGESYKQTLAFSNTRRNSQVLTSLYVLGRYLEEVICWDLNTIRVTMDWEKPVSQLSIIGKPLFENVKLGQYFVKATPLDKFVVFCLVSLFEHGEIRPLFIEADSIGSPLLTRLFSSFLLHSGRRYALTWKFRVVNNLLVSKVDQQHEEIIEVDQLVAVIIKYSISKTKISTNKQEILFNMIPQWIYKMSLCEEQNDVKSNIK